MLRAPQFLVLASLAELFRSIAVYFLFVAPVHRIFFISYRSHSLAIESLRSRKYIIYCYKTGSTTSSD
jgi:hypothetical protein